MKNKISFKFFTGTTMGALHLHFCIEEDNVEMNKWKNIIVGLCILRDSLQDMEMILNGIYNKEGITISIEEKDRDDKLESVEYLFELKQ